MKQSTRVHWVLGRLGGLFIVTMLLVLANNGVWQPAVQALAFQVDTTEDNGALTNCDDAVEEDCSLRGAISRANDNDGADTITFAVPDGAAIVLGGAAGEDDNDSGDLDILDGGDLTIQGNGAANTIIDGDGNDRVFHLCPDGNCSNTITLIGVTIRNGVGGIGGGGGILNNGATLTVQNSTIGGVGFGNWAMIAGGGLYNEAGMTTLDGTTVSANSAGFLSFSGFGGGINNHDTLIVQNGSVIGEVGVANRADRGGGIYNSGTMTVEGSIVISNTADYNGGGIYNNEGTTMVDGSTISANTAVTNGGGIYNHATLIVQNGSVIGGAGGANEATIDGGGIYNHQGTATVDDSVVSANKAGYNGGGIYNEATLMVRNGSTIGGVGTANEAISDGGGIFNAEGGTATVDASAVSANTAGWGGGGICNEDALTVRNGSVVGGAGAGNEATMWGGGIFTDEGTAVVHGSTVSANRAEDGGGIFNWDTVVVEGSTVSANTAEEEGGGIRNLGTAVVDDSTVSDNRAEDGGGIFNRGTATVIGSRILSNTTTSNGNGGGVYNVQNDAGAISVTGSCIVGNGATSFYNSEQAEQQIATGNWWGVATGPNTPGADTVSDNVDTSDFLTQSILGCGGTYYVYLPQVLSSSPAPQSR